MRALWTLVRILLVLISFAMLNLTAVFVSSPSGTSILPSGVVIVAIALVVLVAVGWSLWRDRRALV